MDLFNRSLRADPDDILIRLHAPLPRRLVGAGSLTLLCTMLLWAGLVDRASTGLGLLLLLLGGGGLWFALRLWRSSRNTLELTRNELRETGGPRIARVADIVSVDRGLLGIFAPANGFVVVTRERAPRAYTPGIWWRVGRRIGIGGLTAAGEGKAMAQVLQELLNQRDGKPPSAAISQLLAQAEDEPPQPGGPPRTPG